jgi:hypothetical protein
MDGFALLILGCIAGRYTRSLPALASIPRSLCGPALHIGHAGDVAPDAQPAQG